MRTVCERCEKFHVAKRRLRRVVKCLCQHSSMAPDLPESPQVPAYICNSERQARSIETLHATTTRTNILRASILLQFFSLPEPDLTYPVRIRLCRICAFLIGPTHDYITTRSYSPVRQHV
jgi:hypothetical protein